MERKRDINLNIIQQSKKKKRYFIEYSRIKQACAKKGRTKGERGGGVFGIKIEGISN